MNRRTIQERVWVDVNETIFLRMPVYPANTPLEYWKKFWKGR